MEIKIENQFYVNRFKPGHSRVARCHKPISILCQDFQSKFLNKIIQIIYQVLGMNYYAHARPLTQKGAAPHSLYDQDKTYIIL